MNADELNALAEEMKDAAGKVEAIKDDAEVTIEFLEAIEEARWNANALYRALSSLQEVIQGTSGL